MEEAVEELLSEGGSPDEVLDGLHLSARTALSVPDALYSRVLRGAYSS
jgi:hypothetical protein